MSGEPIASITTRSDRALDDSEEEDLLRMEQLELAMQVVEGEIPVVSAR